MINIVLPNNDEKLYSKINFIFINKKINIILYSEIQQILEKKQNKVFLFINKYLDPINNFIEKLDIILKNIDFCYLSKCQNIFLTKQSNIIFQDNTIDIKKKEINNILFFDNSNIIDHIIPPDYINNEYIELLKLKKISYDSIINFNVSYKSYEKFLKYDVKTNYCYNIILFITDINDLYIELPIYDFYRITIFHTLKNEEDNQKLKGFCSKNKIKFYVYLKHKISWFFNINNTRLLWFEKIILLKDIKLLNLELINKFNTYHKIKDNIIFENSISISASDFVCINLFNIKFDQEYILNSIDVFNIIKNYIINNNNNNIYINYSIKDNENEKYKNKIQFKNLSNFVENQLMLVRNYNLILTNIDEKIKKNYDNTNILNLLLKKISLGTLCKVETEILSDIEIIIKTINDLEFLSNLLILFSNIKNKKIMNKLYIKILNLSHTNKISQITLTCFQNLLALDMEEEAFVTVLDFISYIRKNSSIINVDNDQLKKIITTLFFNLERYIDNTKIYEKFNVIINDVFDMTDVINIDKLLLIDSNTNNIALLHFIIFLNTNFSAYYSSYDEFINKRKEIKDNLEMLLQKNIPICKLNDVCTLPVSNFYLSYQGLPSIDIFKLKSQLIRKICPELNYKIDTNFKNNKINICFHSNFLTRQHSVYKDRHQVIKGLAELNNYNVYFTTFDDLSNDVKYSFGKAKHIKLEGFLDNVRKTLENLKLDVLVYCEIGMDPKAYFMSHLKLAKIQINTWGHSDSSGIDSIDYFFSSKLYELPYKKSQKNYSEKLILLDSLCTYYVNPLKRYNVQTFKNRYEFGFTDEVTIFFCAQSLFKFNPLFDEYIINILNANKNFVLLILNSESKHKIIKRFNNKYITSQIHIFPYMQHNQYLNLINISDVILDPYPFGGCNSSLEAFSLNKVVVTHASNMINGRFTCGFYKHMKMDNIICYSKEKYINLAIKLGNDIKYRKTIEKKISENHHLLFNDEYSIDEWNKNIEKLLKI
jgi:hypothetical protein